MSFLSRVRCDFVDLVIALLRDVFPQWPDEIDGATRELATRIASACTGFRRVKRLWLGHVDSFNVHVLR